MRKALTASLAAACVALGLVSPLHAGEGHDPRASYVDDFIENVPLLLSDGKSATVDWVYLNVGGTVQAANPARGVIRNNQNSLDWGSLPLAGKLANPRYNAADFRPGRSIGEAYYNDHIVWLDLSDEPRRTQYVRIEFLNQDYAYRLKASPLPSDASRLPSQPPGAEIGKIYRGEGGQLLVLVRPFVVTDTLF